MYRNVLVVDAGDQRCLRFVVTRDDSPNQSCRFLSDSKRLVFEYTRMVLAGLMLHPAPEEILVIGLGGGTLAMAYVDLLPSARVTAVELDPAVVSVARKYFGYRDGARVRTVIADGRVFVKRAIAGARRYDLIVVDAFTGDYIPEHMMTREFLEELRTILTPAGLVIANTFADSRLYHHESVTYEAVFPHLLSLRAPGGNRVLYAATRPVGLPPAGSAAVRRLQAQLSPYGIDLSHVLAMQYPPDWNRSARVLTDRYSPGNALRRGPGPGQARP